MLKRCVLFLFLFSLVSPVFSATTTRSGSGSVPEMKFESWRVGVLRQGRTSIVTSKNRLLRLLARLLTWKRPLCIRVAHSPGTKVSHRLIRLRFNGRFLLPTRRVWHLLARRKTGKDCALFKQN